MGVTLSRKRRRSGQHAVLSCDDDNHDIGLSNFTDMGLQFLAEGCPRLEKLCLIWCSAVTSCGLVILAQACRGLKVLDMQVCHPFYNHFINKKIILLPLHIKSFSRTILELQFGCCSFFHVGDIPYVRVMGFFLGLLRWRPRFEGRGQVLQAAGRTQLTVL